MLCLSSPAICRDQVVAQVLADDVAPQRQGEPGLLEPPLAEVDDLVQALVAVVELPLVDDQPGLDAALGDGRQDLVERHDDHRDVLAQAELERQVGRRQRARDGDRPALAGRRASSARG